MKQQVLVYGAGVIGSVYATRLAEAGYHVTLVARGERLQALRAAGLRLRHVFLRQEERAMVNIAQAVDPVQPYELGLVTVRAEQIGEALADVARCTRLESIAVIGNNFEGHAEQAALAGPRRLVLGFGSFGGYREDGVIAYLDGRTARRPEPERRSPTVLGVIGAEARPALERARRVLGSARLRTVVSTDIVAWLRCHAALVFPLAGAIYAAGGDQRRTCRTRDALVLGFRSCRELMRALRARGVPTEPRGLRSLLATPEPLFVPIMRRMLGRESATVAVFGHANAPGGHDEIAGQAKLLDAFARQAGLNLPSWDRILPFFSPGAPPLPEGSRKLRLRLW